MRNEGKWNPGIEYQLKAITYTLACLSENAQVENYQVLTNQDDLGFDDITIKVKFRAEENYRAYLVQVKHSRSKIDLDFTKRKLNDYRIMSEKMLETKDDYVHLRNVPKENFSFWFFANVEIVYSETKPIMLRTEVKPIECDLVREDGHNPIYPSSGTMGWYRLVPRGADREVYPDFFGRLRFILNQPNTTNIFNNISSLDRRVFNSDTISKLFSYVCEYLKKPSTKTKPVIVTKEIFETELLKQCLSRYIATVKDCVEIEDKLATDWNDITLQHDVTIIDNDELEMKPYIFGCFWKTIRKLCYRTMDWNECVSQYNLGKGLDGECFVDLMRARRTRHWLYLPDTIESLLIELWKSDYLPLALESDCALWLLEKYAHLRKKFIILDKRRCVEQTIATNFKRLVNVADIDDTNTRNDLLSKIFVSIQGHPPVDLRSLVSENSALMEQLRCSQILHLSRKRECYLNKKCLINSEYMVFLVSGNEGEEEDIDRDLDNIVSSQNENVVIYCDPEDIEMQLELVRTTLANHTICWVEDLGDKLKFIDSDNAVMLRDLFFYEDEEDQVYFEGIEKVVPIIGNRFKNQNYISRYLIRATVVEECLYTSDRRIYILTGEVNSLTPTVKNITIDGPLDSIQSQISSRLTENRNAIVITDEESVENYWRNLSKRETSICQIRVRNGKMELVRHRKCQNLSSYLSYEGEQFKENDFFSATISNTVIVSGPAGIGKSTLLTHLFSYCDDDAYSLFCDLVDYRSELKGTDGEVFRDPLGFIFDKFEKARSSIHKDFLRVLCTQRTDKSKVVLYLDSFDEIIPVYHQGVIKFMEMVSKIGVRVVVASRLIVDHVLINKFEVQPIKVGDLTFEDVEKYFEERNLPVSLLSKIPRTMLGNPLYLTFLDILHTKDALMFDNLNLFNLCRRVIEEKIKLYYDRRNSFYNPETTQREEVLAVHKLLSFAAIFGRDTVVQNENIYNSWTKSDTIKLGIIFRFTDDGFPIFLHHVYAEFLSAEHLKDKAEQGDISFVRGIYKKTLNGNNIQVRKFFDSLICENLELQEAVIQEDYDRVEHLCVKKTECLDVTDRYQRTALHLAASYCSYEEVTTSKNCKILETLTRYMEQKGCDMCQPDTFLGLQWYKYIEDNELLLEEARRSGLTTIWTYLDSQPVINIEKPMKHST